MNIHHLLNESSVFETGQWIRITVHHINSTEYTKYSCRNNNRRSCSLVLAAFYFNFRAWFLQPFDINIITLSAGNMKSPNRLWVQFVGLWVFNTEMIELDSDTEAKQFLKHLIVKKYDRVISWGLFYLLIFDARFVWIWAPAMFSKIFPFSLCFQAFSLHFLSTCTCSELSEGVWYLCCSYLRPHNTS